MTWEEVKATIRDKHINWRDLFDERQLKEIDFDRVYAVEYAHGTAGHNERLVIAKMAELLDRITGSVEFL